MAQLSRLVSVVILCCFSFHYSGAQDLGIYGYVPDAPGAQLLTMEQVAAIKTYKLEGVPTWLAIAVDLDTAAPKIHFIDNDYFSGLASKYKYGTHQAYAQEMGIVSGPDDFIRKMKGLPGEPRSIMPLTLYIPERSVQSPDGVTAGWVLQNRRYVFKDSSDSFTNSLIKAQQAIQESLPLVAGTPLFITYNNKSKSHRRPNRLTSVGRADIDALWVKGFGTLTEDELAAEAVRP